MSQDVMSKDDILQSFPDLVDYDSAATFLSLMFSDTIKDQVPEGSLGSPESFSCLLHRNVGLFDRVKNAKAAQNLDEVWKKCVEFAQRTNYKSAFLDQIPLILEDMAPNIKDLVTGKAQPLSWTLNPSYSDDTPDINKLDLDSFHETRAPPMLFYELGSFSKYPVLNERLRRLFCNGQDTFLVNASATGKTRLLYEGLCKNWGLYITTHPDGGEACSVKEALANHIYLDRDLVVGLPRASALGYATMLARNRELSNHKLSAVLLAHFLVFKEFLTAVHAQNGTVSEVQKLRWLLAQVETDLIHWRDPYRELALYIGGMSLNAIEEQLTSTLSGIKLLLPDAVARDGFFIAIDEANFAIRELWSSLPGDTGPFPMLKEIICAWKEKLALFTDFPVTFIVAGIEIPQAMFPPLSPEWSAWKWTSDTGSFDEPEPQKGYILPFISPSVMKLTTGEALVRRIWDWHRLTASLAGMLLVDKSAHPHGVLNSYINRLIGFVALDAVEYTAKEGPCKVVPTFGNIGKLSDERPLVQSTVHEVILHYIVTGKHPPCFGIDRVELVSSGVGQFKDGDMKVISLDQPGPTIAAAIRFSETPRSSEEMPILISFKHFTSFFQRQWDNGDAYAPASYIALYLAHAFKDGRVSPLSDTFTVSSSPAWLAADEPLPTQLVVLHKDKDNTTKETTIGSSALLSEAPPIGYSANTKDEVLAWLRHERPGAFCICPPGCEAELIFVLRRRDKYLWVVLRTVGRGSATSIEPEDLHPELERLRAENLLTSNTMDNDDGSDPILDAFAALPNGLAPAGQLSFLRVVATFPSEPELPPKEINGPPVAVLNTVKFQTMTERLSPENLVKTLIASMHGRRAARYPDNMFVPIVPLPRAIMSAALTGQQDDTHLSTDLMAPDEVAELSQSLKAKEATPRPTPKKRKSSDVNTPATSSERRYPPSRAAKTTALKAGAKPPQPEINASPVPQKRPKKV